MPNRDITANYGGVTIGNSQSFTVNVNFGETAQFQAATNDDNLNGVHISSTKPIAVFSGAFEFIFVKSILHKIISVTQLIIIFLFL